jgi:oligosaccharide repeat unit polymerase
MFLGIILILLMLFFIIKAGITHQFSFFYEYGKKYNIGIYPHYIELLFSIYSVFYIVLLLYFFIFLIYSRKFEPVFLIFLLISTFIPSILYGIGHASRGWLFFRLADIFICYVLFRKRISPKINKIIKLTLISVCFLAIVFSLSITYSRFGFGINGLLSILRYFGESFINFNVIIWNNVDIHPLGERLFPDIYQFIVGDITEFSSHYESRPYYTYLTNIPIHLFKTIIGDLYVAFGHIGMVLIIIFISFLGHRYIRYSPEFPFYRLIIYFYYYQLCFGGVFNFVKSGHVNFLIFIGLIIQYLYFRIDFSRNVLMKR